jgi:hypothetical protein
VAESPASTAEDPPSRPSQPSLLGEGGTVQPPEAPAADQPPQTGPSESAARARSQKRASQSRKKASGRRRPSPSPTVDDPGADLERRVGRVEFAEGALVRLRVPVRVDEAPGRDIVTDLDVVAVDIDQRLRLSRSILECKSGQGQTQELDRLFWLAGLRDYVHADRAGLVRSSVSSRGRQIARGLGLNILDLSKLEAREAAHAWLPEKFAHVGGPGCVAAETRTDIQLKGLAHLAGDYLAFLRHDAFLAPPHRVIAALSALASGVASGGPIPEPTGTVIAGQSLVALILAATIDAQTLDVLPVDQLQRRLELTLMVGSPEDESVLDILSSADALFAHFADSLHRAYEQSGLSRVEVPLPSILTLISQSPEWVPRYIDLLEAMRANTSISRELPQTAELACFDALLGDAAYQSPAFDHLFTVEHRQLLRVAVRTLKAIVGAGLADHLGAGFAEISFDRTRPAIPERRVAPTTGSATAELATDIQVRSHSDSTPDDTR